MKRIFFSIAFGIGILSCIFLLCLFFLLFFPVSSIKIVNQYAVIPYTINFSNIENTGNILNQNLKFFDLHIKQNDRSTLKLKELELGISIKPQIFLQPVNQLPCRALHRLLLQWVLNRHSNPKCAIDQQLYLQIE